MRQHPRFITHEQIRLEVQGRNDLRPVWMSDISKGGLFIRTEQPPPLRTSVQVTIQSPEGQLALTAEVVHVIEGEGGGVGLQFMDLTPERRQRIEAYVEGLAASLDDAGSNHDLSSQETRVVQEAVTTFVHGFDQDNLYAALDLDPESTASEVEARLVELETLFATKATRLPPALATRLDHCRQLLRKVGPLMRDPTRRRDYDFRHGYVFAEQRIVAGRTATAVAVLQGTWQNIYPERVHNSRRATAEAIRAVNKLEYEVAVTQGEQALTDDPFNLELREALREWKARLSRRNGPMPGVSRKRSA